MLKHALNYLRLGLSVIPLRPKGKEPLIKWIEYQQRRATEAEVHSWFAKTADAGIGIVTGIISGVAVVDLDGPAGIASAVSLGLKSSVVSLTGNGRHLWYKNAGITQNAVRILPGVDVRAEGGYVVAPPSPHESGRRYRWLGQAYSDSLKLPIFPTELLNVPVVAQEKFKEESWIAKALEGMKIGNIDDTLVSVLGRLRNDGYSREDSRTLLTPHALAAGAVPGHLEEKIENVWSRYDAKKSVSAIENEEAESIKDFLQTDEKVEWLIPGIIAKNSIGFCVGLPEAQKTWLMMDLAVKAATGGDWCGLFPVKRTKTLFIEQERFKGETKRRFKSLLFNADCGDYLHIKCGSSIKIDLEHSFNAFSKLLDKLRPELVIIDSLVTIHTKEENNRTEIQSVMEKFKTLRQQFNCAFFFISHSNKFAFQSAKEGQEPDVSLMAGSIALPAAAETVLMVQKAAGGGSTVHHVKSTLSQKIDSFGIVVEDVSGGITVRGIK